MDRDENAALAIGCAYLLAVLLINFTLIAAIAIAIKWVIS